MSLEVPSSPSAQAERTNWNEILRNSFLFSQGDPALQEYLFNYFATGPLAAGIVTDADFKQKMITTHAANLVDEDMHRHVDLSKGEESSDEEQNRKRLMQALDNKEVLEVLKGDVNVHLSKLTYTLISRDLGLLNRRGSMLSRETERDVHSSFFIDFGILQKGTYPWKWDTLPQVYKTMWEDVARYAVTSGLNQGSQMFTLISSYLKTHPDLSEDDRKKIQEFVGV